MASKKTKKSNVVATCIAVLLVAVLICMVLTQGFKEWNPYCWFGHDYENDVCVRCGAEEPAEDKKDDKQDAEANGGMLVGGGYGNGIRLLSTNISREMYNDYGISPLAESAQQLKAIVEPIDTDHPNVEWHIAWKNANSAWAKGKTVTNYVTVTPTINSQIANVACLQPFGEQIYITASSTDFPEIVTREPCTVDYVQKITAINFNMANIVIGGNTFTYSVETTDYTIEADISISVSDKISLTNQFVEALYDSFEEHLHDYTSNKSGGHDIITVFESAELSCNMATKTITIANNFVDLFAAFVYPNEQIMDELEAAGVSRYSIFKYAMSWVSNGNANHATFDVTYTASYKGVTYTSGTEHISVNFDVDSFTIPVTGVSFDKTDLLF